MVLITLSLGTHTHTRKRTQMQLCTYINVQQHSQKYTSARCTKAHAHTNVVFEVHQKWTLVCDGFGWTALVSLVDPVASGVVTTVMGLMMPGLPKGGTPTLRKTGLILAYNRPLTLASKYQMSTGESSNGTHKLCPN